MRARWTNKMAGLALVWLALPGLCAEPSTAQERLEQARLKVLDQALKASTRVESWSWMDASGRLQEHQSMRQAVQWPALQGAKAQEAPQDLLHPASASQSPTSAAVDQCPKHTAPKNLHPTLALHTQWPDRLPMGIQERLQESVNGQWLGSAAKPHHWRMHTGLNLPAQLSTYERLLLSPPAQDSAWQVHIKLDVLDSLQPHTQRLVWHLALTHKDRLVAEQRTEQELPVRRQSWGASEWTAQSWQAIGQQLRQWSSLLDQQLACERPQPQVVASTGQQWTLDMGRLAGLRLGDEWALVDPAKLPERSLEPGAIGQMVVARVVRLQDMRAELALVAGEAHLPRNGWIAHPLSLAAQAQDTTAPLPSQYAQR